MTDIYEQLWAADENRCTVSARGADGTWIDPAADILLDVQRRASGKRNIDAATNPLFAKVNEAKFALPTYRGFIALLDNYVTNAREAEEESPGERAEIEAFLDAVCATKVAALARTYINEQLGETLTEKQFRASLDRLWFTLYTNHFGNRSTEYASGFEHVFVGEGKYDTRFGGGESLGEISGYHSWVKFYLDERAQRVDFLGYKFDLGGGEGPDNPDVVTLQMLWYLSDLQGRVVAQLFKKKGGFFVGPSPECELVMGAVAFYESVYGKLRQDKRATTINGGNYQLVLFRNTTPQNTRGDYIRSFYPEYHGRGDEPAVDRTNRVEIPNGGLASGAVSIVAALPNPKGEDRGNEWVRLRNNTGADIDLQGWTLADRGNRSEALGGTIPAGAELVVKLRGDGVLLGNKGGLIALHDTAGLVAAVQYGKANEGEEIAFGSTP